MNYTFEIGVLLHSGFHIVHGAVGYAHPETCHKGGNELLYDRMAFHISPVNDEMLEGIISAKVSRVKAESPNHIGTYTSVEGFQSTLAINIFDMIS